MLILPIRLVSSLVLDLRPDLASASMNPAMKAVLSGAGRPTAIAKWAAFTMDMTFREDESRIREAQTRENFAWLNRFSLSLLKQHPGKDSIAMKRRACGWSDEFLLQIFARTTP